MKIMMVTIHNPLQIITLEEEIIGRNNTISQFDIIDNSSFPDLAIQLQKNDHDISYISNFSSAPQSIKIINKLEKENVSVYPDLQENIIYDIEIKSNDVVHHFKNKNQLNLNNYHFSHIKEAQYIITDQSNYHFLSQLYSINEHKIIIIDNMPMYRALDFVEGIVLSEVPENKDETILSLIQSGLSWIAIQNEAYLEFYTLKYSFKLNFNNITDFINQFLYAIETKTLISWLETNKIKGL
ncbi:MAG: hypothetical protein GX984_06555 [Erysipelothrix sp.]|nr:hypothetical protein [Erysipelothrix sp.]